MRRGEDAAVLAPRRAEVRQLSEIARRLLVDEPPGAEPMAIQDREFTVGDLVLLRRNDHVLDFQNSTRGRTVGVDTNRESMRVELLDGSVCELPSRYLRSRSSNASRPSSTATP